jgi:hypothetical protein
LTTTFAYTLALSQSTGYTYIPPPSNVLTSAPPLHQSACPQRNRPFNSTATRSFTKSTASVNYPPIHPHSDQPPTQWLSETLSMLTSSLNDTFHAVPPRQEQD